MDIDRVVTLPIAQPTDAIRAEVEPAVGRLIALTKDRRGRIRESLDWLRVEFEIATPGQKLEAFPTLDEETFIEEVRKRRPNKSARLSPAALRDLREMYGQYVPMIRTLDGEMQQLERRLSDLVNQAYGLTPDEIDLMLRTAPPRMPLKPD